MGFALADAGVLALYLAETANAANLWCQRSRQDPSGQTIHDTDGKAYWGDGPGKARGARRGDI
jgi:hypothetical protein